MLHSTLLDSVGKPLVCFFSRLTRLFQLHVIREDLALKSLFFGLNQWVLFQELLLAHFKAFLEALKRFCNVLLLLVLLAHLFQVTLKFPKVGLSVTMRQLVFLMTFDQVLMLALRSLDLPFQLIDILEQFTDMKFVVLFDLLLFFFESANLLHNLSKLLLLLVILRLKSREHLIMLCLEQSILFRWLGVLTGFRWLFLALFISSTSVVFISFVRRCKLFAITTLWTWLIGLRCTFSLLFVVYECVYVCRYE